MEKPTARDTAEFTVGKSMVKSRSYECQVMTFGYLVDAEAQPNRAYRLLPTLSRSLKFRGHPEFHTWKKGLPLVQGEGKTGSTSLEVKQLEDTHKADSRETAGLSLPKGKPFTIF